MTATYIQVPRDLLYSRDHSGLAVAVWCRYETLQNPTLTRDRTPAHARRQWVANLWGCSERTVDRARTQLLNDHGDGPWLARQIRGRKRAAWHWVLRHPRDTRERYAEAPTWTLDRIHIGTSRPAGSVSPDVWRLFVILCHRLDKAGHDLTLTKMAEWAGCSTSTVTRRLAELEAVRWVRIRRRTGEWMHVQAVRDEHLVDTLEEDDAADPVDSLASQTSTHAPADVATPYDAPSENSPSKDARGARPAVGEQQDRKRAVATRKRGTDTVHADDDNRQVAAVWTALPPSLRATMPAHGRRRVRAVISKELATGSRTADELMGRVGRRWLGGEWKREQIDDPTAVAMTLVRLVRPCGNRRCEDGTDLDSGLDCKACVETRQARRVHHRSERGLSGEAVLEEEPASDRKQAVVRERHPDVQVSQRVDADGPDGPAARARAALEAARERLKTTAPQLLRPRDRRVPPGLARAQQRARRERVGGEHAA
ncbi:hypothetical protein ACQEVF_58195 [Nonomuraea polychroma]|uniref:hypothetical protein n=1 Tax=Nonomuraea polychroma TaxID=46176 RepID=UPI003D8A2B34